MLVVGVLAAVAGFARRRCAAGGHHGHRCQRGGRAHRDGVAPTAWAVSELDNPPLNASLPQAGPRWRGRRRRSAPTHRGSRANDALAAFSAVAAQRRTVGPRRHQREQGAELIASDKLSVMALGGFLGSDPAPPPVAIADLVAAGEVRYFLAGGGFGGFGGGGFGGGAPGGGGAPPFGPGGVQGLIKSLPPGFLREPPGGKAAHQVGSAAARASEASAAGPRQRSCRSCARPAPR